MDMLIIGFLLVVGYVYGSPPPFLPHHGSVALRPNNTTFSDTCHSELSCADCSNVRFCRQTAAGWLKITTVTCPQEAPYCDPARGSCRVEPSELCYNIDDFICPDDGYYPDANDCTVFHVCNNFTAMKFQCPVGENYDADNRHCSSEVPCQTAECVGKTLTKTKLASTHYYAYCSSGKPVFVLRCPGGYKLSEIEQTCEATCENDGFILDLVDCTKYYQCTSVNGSFRRQHFRCLPGHAFDSSSFRCLPMHLTNCNRNNDDNISHTRSVKNDIHYGLTRTADIPVEQ